MGQQIFFVFEKQMVLLSNLLICIFKASFIRSILFAKYLHFC